MKQKRRTKPISEHCTPYSSTMLALANLVFAGTIIGRSGSTGRAISEHLHIVTKHKGIIFDSKILFCYIKSHQK